jgi:hypothetical protein
MHLERCGPSQSKNKHVYWELVESYRSERGPRQRVVAYLGNISRSEGENVKQAAEGKTGYWHSQLFDAEGPPEWAEVDTKRIYVLWKMLGQMCKRAGLGDEPRQVPQIKVVDVIMSTRQVIQITKCCISQPTESQGILVQKLRLHLPQYMKIAEM